MVVRVHRGSDRRFRNHPRDFDFQFRAFREEMSFHDQRGVAAGQSPPRWKGTAGPWRDWRWSRTRRPSSG